MRKTVFIDPHFNTALSAPAIAPGKDFYRESERFWGKTSSTDYSGVKAKTTRTCFVVSCFFKRPSFCFSVSSQPFASRVERFQGMVGVPRPAVPSWWRARSRLQALALPSAEEEALLLARRLAEAKARLHRHPNFDRERIPEVSPFSPFARVLSLESIVTKSNSLLFLVNLKLEELIAGWSEPKSCPPYI